MKKLIIICSLFLLTACDNTEVFNKTCEKKVKSNNTDFTQKIKFVFNNKDEVLNVIVTNKYVSDENELELIKDSASDYNNGLIKNNYVKVQIVKDEEDKYVVKYYFDVTKMNNNDLSKFNLKSNWIDLNNKINNSDLECD